MEQQSIGRALKQVREDKKMTREEVVVRLSNLKRKRVLTTVRTWEVKGSIKLDDAVFYVTRVLGVTWDEFEAEVERQERLARRKPRPPKGPRKPRGDAGTGGAAAEAEPDPPA